MKKGTPKTTRVKKPGDWFCPQCFVQNSVDDERCSNCFAEKDDETAHVVLSASSKELGAKEEQSQLRASSNSIKKLAPPAPEMNVSHYCEWGWFYCDGLICQDPEYNRSIDIMADLVQVDTYDEVLDTSAPEICYDSQWQIVLEEQLTELGMWPHPFVNDEIANPIAILSLRQKRQKKKDIELKKIGDILERWDPSMMPKSSLENSGGKKPKKKSTTSGPRLNTRQTYDEDESEEGDPDVLSFESEEEIKPFGDHGYEHEPVEKPKPALLVGTTADQNDLDLQLALSLQWQTENISQPISKSREISNPSAWPSLSAPSTPKRGGSPWPSSSPATPKAASPWASLATPTTSTPVSPVPKPASKWGAQSLAQKIGQKTPGTPS